MNHDIFISYSSKQKSIADGVCHYLEENGFKCWMAPRDIPIGSEYGDLIEEAIKACKAIVLVFSEAASISKWVKGEINVAFSEDKPILPFRVDETEIKGGFRVMLNQMHWIDAYPHYADRLPDLLNSISSLLGRPLRKVVVQGDTSKRDETIREEPNRSEKSTITFNSHEYVDLGVARKKCPNCHRDVTEDSVYCEYCGTALKKCPRCHRDIVVSSVFCEYCGFRVL